MTDKHTPGPWTLHQKNSAWNLRGGNDEFGIGQIHGWWAGSKEEQQAACANARLIASAPAMLAALRAMVGMTINSGHVSDDMAPALNMALAVIKEATGETE